MKKIYVFISILFFLGVSHLQAQQWTLVGQAAFSIARGMYFVDNDLGYVTSEIGGISKTTDGGVTWIQQTSGVTTALRSVHFLDANTGYVCGFGGVLLRTSDGGNTWTSLTDTITVNLRSIQFVSEEIGFVAGSAGVIYRTLDGGATWSPYSFGITSDIIQLYFLDEKTGFAVASAGVSPFASGYVFKTVDGGNSWSTIHQDALVGLLGLAVSNENFIVIGGSYQTLKQTLDGGTNWDTITSNTVGTPSFRGGYAVANSVYMIDDAGNIFSTIDGGANWTSTLVSTGFYSIHFPSAEVGYVGDVAGNIYKLSEQACAQPTGLTVATITPTSAKLQWDAASDAIGYKITYHPAGTPSKFQNPSKDNTKLIKNLTPDTKYKWAVQTVCANNPLVASLYVIGPNFTTPPLRLGEEATGSTDMEIFPNPASENATISFSLSESSPVMIRLVDINGKVVHEIENASYPSGSHQVSFITKQIPAGAYLLQLTTNEEVITKKLMIER